MNDRTKSTPKNKKLRHNEYYGIQTFLDNLYQKATKKNSFKNLMPIIISDENILLAFRNIKGNKGSKTAACDNVNIKDIERMEQSYFLNEVKDAFKLPTAESKAQGNTETQWENQTSGNTKYVG